MVDGGPVYTCVIKSQEDRLRYRKKSNSVCPDWDLITQGTYGGGLGCFFPHWSGNVSRTRPLSLYITSSSDFFPLIHEWINVWFISFLLLLCWHISLCINCTEKKNARYNVSARSFIFLIQDEREQLCISSPLSSHLESEFSTLPKRHTVPLKKSKRCTVQASKPWSSL